MITMYKDISQGVRETSSFEKDCWINVSSPTNEEIAKLSEEYGIPSDFLIDPLDVDERARVEIEGKITLIVLRIPKMDKNNGDIPYSTLPLGIIFSEDFILTICADDSQLIQDFIAGKIKNCTIKNKIRFILQILLRSSLLYLNYLKDINKKTNEVEKVLHKSMKNTELSKLLNLEKSLVFFTTSLRSNEIMMERLQKMEFIQSDPVYSDQMEDVIIENRQAITTAKIYSDILSGMMDAFASIISNNLNSVIKVLTVVTIILTIPTIVVGAYGMNVELPFQHSPIAFPIVVGISLILTILCVLIFVQRKWF